MGRSSRNCDREYNKLQQVLHENKALKRQIGALRKQLARLDLDRHAYIKDILEQSFEAEESNNSQEMLDKLKKEWKCEKSGCDGFLEIILYNKLTDTYYYRACNSCSNRTKSQKYNPYVKGILKNSHLLDKK